MLVLQQRASAWPTQYTGSSTPFVEARMLLRWYGFNHTGYQSICKKVMPSQKATETLTTNKKLLGTWRDHARKELFTRSSCWHVCRWQWLKICEFAPCSFKPDCCRLGSSGLCTGVADSPAAHELFLCLPLLHRLGCPDLLPGSLLGKCYLCIFCSLAWNMFYWSAWLLHK